MSDVIVTVAYVVSGVCLVLTLLVMRCKGVYDASRVLFEEAGEAFQEGDMQAGSKLQALGRKEFDRAESMFINDYPAIVINDEEEGKVLLGGLKEGDRNQAYLADGFERRP